MISPESRSLSELRFLGRKHRVPGMDAYLSQLRSSPIQPLRLFRCTPEARRRSGDGGQTPQRCGPKNTPAPPDTDR
jgi:hypothetical protein